MFARRIVAGALCATLAAGVSVPAMAQVSVVTDQSSVRAGELQVPVNKSQVLRVDRSYGKALIGNPDIADVLPLTDRSIYVLGKKVGTTSLAGACATASAPMLPPPPARLSMTNC